MPRTSPVERNLSQTFLFLPQFCQLEAHLNTMERAEAAQRRRTKRRRAAQERASAAEAWGGQRPQFEGARAPLLEVGEETRPPVVRINVTAEEAATVIGGRGAGDWRGVAEAMGQGARNGTKPGSEGGLTGARLEGGFVVLE